MPRARPICNKGTVTKRGKSRHVKKRRKQEEKKVQMEKKIKNVIVEDVELLSREQLKKLKKQPTNNIRVSGKRKQKMLKRLRHSTKDKSQMDVERENCGSSRSPAQYDTDVVMQDVDDNDSPMT